MRHIDMETWPRREHFEFFNAFDYPHFSLCANVDLTSFYPAVKRRGISFSVAIVYVMARAANEIPEFRYRTRGREVIEHEVVHPSMTVLTKENLFSFCTLEYSADFATFAAGAAEQIAHAHERSALEDRPGQDDLFYMTAIPWVSFTNFMHPIHMNPADSVPRFAWGKIFQEDEAVKMPLSVQGHHALMDGLHVGMFYGKVQNYWDHPDFLPSSA